MDNHYDLELDHIVVTVGDLNYGIEIFKNQLGCELVFGGKHPHLGTHNALLILENSKLNVYLELISIDPHNNNSYSSYPFGLDKLNKSNELRLASWAVRTINMDNTLEKIYNLDKKYYSILKTYGSRVNNGIKMEWNVAKTEQINDHNSKILPFLMEWKNNITPVKYIPEECTCKSFDFCVFSQMDDPLINNLQDNLKFVKFIKSNERKLTLELRNGNKSFVLESK